MQVQRIVKHQKRNKELTIAKICKHNPKSVYSYINERRIVRDNIGPFKTLDGTVITTDNDMGNTMNNYFNSVFTIKQWNNVAQSGQYEGNILDTFNFSTEEVQEKLQHLNIYKSTGPDMLHPRIDSLCIRGQTCQTPDTHI